VRSLGAQYSMELSDPTDPRPYMTAPIALATQLMACNAPGEEPDLALPPFEDTARLTWLNPGGGAGAGAGSRGNSESNPKP
jgi:hypothetical protein